jgi:hypothetical protein
MPKHPTPIAGTTRVIGACPSGPLTAWDELYPDGTVRTFMEVYTVTEGASGTKYGGTVVVPA